MEEVTRLIQYIKYTKHYKLILGTNNKINLFGMSDASFVQSGDCKSQLGYAIYLSNDCGAIYCRSMHDTITSLSSTMAEVSGLVELVKEIVWFQGFLKELHINIIIPTVLYVDNKPTVTLSKEGNHLKKSKQYLVKTTYMKDLSKSGIIIPTHISGIDNHADILTKGLQGVTLLYHSCGILGKQY